MLSISGISVDTRRTSIIRLWFHNGPAPSPPPPTHWPSIINQRLNTSPSSWWTCQQHHNKPPASITTTVLSGLYLWPLYSVRRPWPPPAYKSGWPLPPACLLPGMHLTKWPVSIDTLQPRIPRWAVRITAWMVKFSRFSYFYPRKNGSLKLRMPDLFIMLNFISISRKSGFVKHRRNYTPRKTSRPLFFIAKTNIEIDNDRFPHLFKF